MISYERILNIINPDQLSRINVIAVGVGSGNSATIAELAKNGFSKFALFDHDCLEPENLVRHTLGSSFIGRPKVDGMKEWLYDRNPKAVVITDQQRFQNSTIFQNAISDRGPKIVLCGVDDHLDRLELNEICVRESVPFVLGMVFRRGVGGLVFRYVPGQTGCFNCLSQFADRAGLTLSATESERSDYSDEQIYGLSLPRFIKSPGLSIDIGFISLIMARVSIDTAVKAFSINIDLPQISANSIVFSTQPNSLIGGDFFSVQNQILVRRQNSCFLCAD